MILWLIAWLLVSVAGVHSWLADNAASLPYRFLLYRWTNVDLSCAHPRLFFVCNILPSLTTWSHTRDGVWFLRPTRWLLCRVAARNLHQRYLSALYHGARDSPRDAAACRLKQIIHCVFLTRFSDTEIAWLTAARALKCCGLKPIIKCFCLVHFSNGEIAWQMISRLLAGISILETRCG